MRRFALAVVFLGSLTFAQEVGNVSNLVPAASITREKKTAEAKVADPVWLNDVLRTDKAGRMRLKLADGSLLTVGSAAELRVAKHDPNAQQSEIELLYGTMRGEVQSVTKKGGYFTIKTPTAAIGVIGTTVGAEVVQTETAATTSTLTAQQLENLPTTPGTDFRSLVQLLPGDPNSPYHDIAQYTGAEKTIVWSENHLVFVRNINPTVSGSVVLMPWEFTVVNRNQPPTPPQKLTSDHGPSSDAAKLLLSLLPTAPKGFDGYVAVLTGFKKDGSPQFDYLPCTSPLKTEIRGGGTSTGNVFKVHVENPNPCPVQYGIPAGSILKPTGFWERKLLGTFLGGNPEVKNFQIMMSEGGSFMIPPAQPATGGKGDGEPLKPGTADFDLRGFCLELHKLAPHPSTKYEFDDGEIEHFDPNRQLLGKVYQMYFEHQLDPQYTLEGTAQWTIWASREGMDEKKFREAYIALSRQNIESRKEKWNKEAEQKARAFADAFWVQVDKILTANKADQAANKP